MTWTKLGDEFSDDMANRGLSDAAYRTHVEAVQWIYRVERYDCHVPKSLVRRFAGSSDYELAIKELINSALWADGGDHYAVVHHADVIRSSLVAQRNKRDRDRRAQQNHRRRSGDVSADVSDYPDRQTDITKGEPPTDMDWPATTLIPGDD